MSVDDATDTSAPATDAAAVGDDSPITVMVVEDYAPLRTLCSRLLQRSGYELIAVGCADDAMELLTGGVVPIVVVTDLNMPGDVTGEHLIDHLRHAHPGTGIVVMTGTTTDTITAREREAVLVKPFDNADLLSTVARVLVS